MSKNKIVLFNPKTGSGVTSEKDIKSLPLSLLAISSFLVKEGYEIKIIDSKIESDYEEMVKREVKDAICFGVTSMTGYQIHEGLDVSKIVKENYPDVTVVWGGFHPSILPDLTLSSPFIDVVVRGQGEITFRELVTALKNNEPLSSISGISFKDKDRKVTHNPDRKFEDINNFPRLPYHLINMEKYITNYPIINSRTINIYTSQGCPYNCKFCADALMYGRKWSGLTSARVLEDIEFLVNNYNINGFVLNDDNFFVDKKRVKEICDGIISKGLKIKYGWVFGRTDVLKRYDEGLLRLLKESGMRSILIGAESGSQEALDFVDKKITAEGTLELWKRLSPLGIKVFFSFMLGFPIGEDLDEIKKNIEAEFNATLDLIGGIQKIGENNFIMIYPYAPYPGTPLFELSKKHGFITPTTLEEWSKYNIDSIHTPFISQNLQIIVDQLNLFILPYISDTYKNYMDNSKRMIVIRELFMIVHKILRMSAKSRWKHRFFSIPIEYKLIKLWSKKRTA